MARCPVATLRDDFATLVAIAVCLVFPTLAQVPSTGFQNRYYQVTGYTGSRVLEHNQTGSFSSYVEVTWTQSATVDAENRIWLVDRAYHQVILIPTGTRYVSWPAYYEEYAGQRGKPGHFDGSRQQALFDSPYGIAVKRDAAAALVIYVADTNNHCVRRLYFSTGRTTTIAGSPGSAGLVDGTSIRSRFRFPMSLGLDSEGRNLLVLDNSRQIRRIDISQPSAIVTTLLGGACRSVAQWILTSSIVMRTVGCHMDWAQADGTVEKDAVDVPFCVGHMATCGPRNHPALSDRDSEQLMFRPQDQPSGRLI